MALKLTVVTTDSTIQKYELVLDQPEITVGRSAACHIQLPFSTISSHHFTIVREGRSHLIVDQGSTNGTRLGDKILAPAHYTALKDGDKIVLTGVEINVAILTEPVDVMDAARTGEAVRAMVFEMLRHSGELDDTAAWIEVLEGPDKGRRKRLPSGGQGDLSVGNEGAEWILSDEGLSTPLQFEVRAENFFVRPPDNPGAVLLIDGKPLSGSAARPLRSGTRLRIAQTTLLFVDPLQTYLDQLEDPPRTTRTTPPSASTAPMR